MSAPQTRRSPGTTSLQDRKNIGGAVDYPALIGSRPEVQTDPRVAFMDAMRAQGFEVESVEADGSIHRARVEGDRAGQRNGWYVLHADGIAAGAFGSWKTGESHTWRATGGNFTPDERERLRASWVEAQRERDANRELEKRAAQTKAQRLWHEALPAIEAHPYLLAKLVKPHGIRQHHNLLLVPMRDTAGELWAVQTIAPDGTKRFLRDARKRGLYHAMGAGVAEVVAICEGYATAASVHEATGYAVAVAFDAGNMEPVAMALRLKFPQTRIVICADDDRATEDRTGRNPGMEAARRAAQAVGGRVVAPTFGGQV